MLGVAGLEAGGTGFPPSTREPSVAPSSHMATDEDPTRTPVLDLGLTAESMSEDLDTVDDALIEVLNFLKFSSRHSVVLQIAVRLGANMEIKDKRGATPLFFACEAGRSRPVDFLAQSGAILSTGNSSAEAPLYIAALRGNAEIVQTLLSAFEERQISWVVSLVKT